MAPMAALMIAEIMPVPRLDADLRQQPVANECADNAYYESADESEPGPPYDLSGQPASNKTDDKWQTRNQ
jgi:hypothetical protein